jgi:DNA-binding NarL/FixJ family response regulator
MRLIAGFDKQHLNEVIEKELVCSKQELAKNKKLMEKMSVQYGLTYRESEVAFLVKQGLTNKIIGQKLFVCEKTIKFHTRLIYKKLGVKSRAEFIVKVLNEKD